jgi:predicted TPR repeat methyltransferase
MQRMPRPGSPHGVAKAARSVQSAGDKHRDVQHAVSLLRQERLEEAEAALLQVLARWPDEPNALHFLGVLRHTQGRADEAVALIRQSLAALPDNAGAWNNLGNVQLAAGRMAEALAAYEQGVAMAAPGQPGRAEALNNLGTLHRKLDRLEASEAACRQAIAERADFGDAWYNLSQTLMALGRVHEGLVANSKAVALWPRHLQARDQVIRALVLLGEREQAATLYREWLAEEPDNPVVRHQLAACLGAGPGSDAPERASDAYVQQVFDAFAASFDAKLEMLHYRAPALVAQALAQAVGGEPAGALVIVDAGCGTGLCGPLLRPWARRLAGCDLSEGMLRRAHARRQDSGQPVYDVLHQAELVHYLDTQPEAYDVIVSADTLCYFGALEAATAAARRALRPGGWLVFTVEALPDDAGPAHVLQANGRYAHAGDYLSRTLAAAGLTLVAQDKVALRLEAGLAVPGWLVTVVRSMNTR